MFINYSVFSRQIIVIGNSIPNKISRRGIALNHKALHIKCYVIKDVCQLVIFDVLSCT